MAGAVEKTELLLAVGGIVGGIDIEQDRAAFPHLVAAASDVELLDESVVEVYQITVGRSVLPAAEGRLGAERVAEFLIGDDLQHGIVAQTLSIIGVFVTGDDLVDALPHQLQRVVTDAVVLPRVAEQRGQIAGQMMALVEGAQGQQAGIAGDLPAGKIGANGLMTVEGEGQLW